MMRSVLSGGTSSPCSTSTWSSAGLTSTCPERSPKAGRRPSPTPDSVTAVCPLTLNGGGPAQSHTPSIAETEAAVGPRAEGAAERERRARRQIQRSASAHLHGGLGRQCWRSTDDIERYVEHCVLADDDPRSSHALQPCEPRFVVDPDHRGRARFRGHPSAVPFDDLTTEPGPGARPGSGYEISSAWLGRRWRRGVTSSDDVGEQCDHMLPPARA